MSMPGPLPGAPVIVVLDQSNAYQARVVVGVRSVLEPLRIPLLLVARDPFALGLTSGLQRALDTLGPRGVITNTLDTPEGERHLRAALALRPDLPTVHVGSAQSGCSVRADNAGGMAAIVRHLITDCGVSRPVVVRGIRHQPDSTEREGVLRQIFAEHRLELDEALFVDGHFHRDNAYRSVRDLLRRRTDLDAVIAFNDRSALGAMDAVIEAGLRVPQDVVVSGFDDDELGAFSLPPLTTVSQEVEEQGAMAARLLLRLIAGERVGEVRIPTRLVVRGSTRQPSIPAAPAAGESRLWAEVAALDTTLSMTRALMRCATIPELVRELAAALPRLNILRCLVVLLQPQTTTGTVILAYAPGLRGDPAREQVFEAERLLPPDLVHHLHEGTLTLQPLSTERREFGYLLIQQQDADRFVSDALRMDLSRTLESLSRTAELAHYAQTLEALVADRTRELEAEVATRRRAQDSLLVLNQELRSRLHIDGLTGICNRVGFDAALADRWLEHSRSGAPLSLLMIDADHFKRYNDTHGHLAGDECLRVVAASLRDAIRRPHDLAARYGGEEFAVILPNTLSAGALLIAERVHTALAAAAIRLDSPQGLVTVSIGAATSHPHQDRQPATIVAAADSALYAAKAAGRDCTMAAADGVLAR